MATSKQIFIFTNYFMLNIYKVVSFIAGLLWLFGQTVFSHAQTASQGHFIRIGDDLEIVVSDNPAIAYSNDELNIPDDSQFAEVGNTDSGWYQKANSSPNWVRVILRNPSDSPLTAIVRYGYFPTEIHLLYKDSTGKWIRKKAGILVKASDTLTVNFHGCKMELRPGIDTVYFHNADTWNKFHYNFIEFLNPVNLMEFTYDFKLIMGKLGYVLFAFIMLLLFQLFYVIIQSIYHRGPEYREYIFYLITILVYFVIRYELSFNTSIITFGEPGLRRLLNDLLLFLPFVFYLRFSRYFIEMSIHYPEMNRRIKVVEYVIFVLAVIFVVMYFSEWKNYEGVFSQVVILTLSLYSLRLIWFFLRKQDKRTRFILAGSLAATTGHFMGMMSSWFDIIRDIIDFPPIYYTMIGLSFEIFFFNTGLGYKAKSEQEEKVNAQEKLISQFNENRRMQERLETMRNKIASDLHDDVGSTLSSIGLYSEVGIDQIEKNTPYVKGILEKIALSSQRMMTAMNDIVWAIHSRHDEGEGLVERIRHFAEERLGSSGIKFTLKIDQAAEKIRFSMEARRNILLIFKEAINNSAKYSGSGEIICSITIKGKFLVCAINDSGVGISNSVKQDGNGFITMKNRATEMKGTLAVITGQHGGTTVEASLPLNEVALYGAVEASRT